VAARERVDVEEGEGFVRLEELEGRDFVLDDLAENARCHFAHCGG
jgi:hypothetical protein